VTLYYSSSIGVWNIDGNSISAAYQGPISGSNYEFWDFSAAIGSTGIQQFYLMVSKHGVLGVESLRW
jgi:glucoamylase